MLKVIVPAMDYTEKIDYHITYTRYEDRIFDYDTNNIPYQLDHDSDYWDGNDLKPVIAINGHVLCNLDLTWDGHITDKTILPQLCKSDCKCEHQQKYQQLCIAFSNAKILKDGILATELFMKFEYCQTYGVEDLKFYKSDDIRVCRMAFDSESG